MAWTDFKKPQGRCYCCFFILANFICSLFQAAQLSAFKCHKEEVDKRLISLVVDTGYSFTHIVPVFNGKILKKGIKR